MQNLAENDGHEVKIKRRTAIPQTPFSMFRIILARILNGFAV